MSFSQDIESYVKEQLCDVSDLSVQEQQDIAEGRKIAETVATQVIRSREMLAEIRSRTIETFIHTNPDLIEDVLDEYFTVEVIHAVPGYVERILQLSQMEASTTPSDITNSYIREATRTYILGFPLASIALSRAALEQGLKERLGYPPVQNFQQLLKDARRWNLLDDCMESTAREVANTADDVLHEKPVDISKAREILDKLRGVLQHVYSTEGHY